MNWQSISRDAQRSVLDAIPSEWRLSSEDRASAPANVSTYIEDQKLLSARQLELTAKDATALLVAIHSGSVTSHEVVEAFCARAAYAHQLTNCLTSYFPIEALEQAARLDKILKETGKVVGPLHGLPISIKDTFHVYGKPSTLGYVALHDNIAKDDAVVVQMLRSAGAIIHCKTTMPQTGMALETASNLWGLTLNPFNTKFGAGGSSGGDGALVAMHGAPAAPMTDIGGSIRAPAAFNGLYAIRPTADRIPKTGLHSYNPGQMSIRVSIGPGCHSVSDLKIITPVINAYPYAEYDSSCVPVPWRSVTLPARPLKIGILSTDHVVTPHPPVTRALRETAEQLRRTGHEVFEFELPFDAWEISQDTFKLYFQTGAAEAKALIATSGEPTLPVFQHYLDTFGVKEFRAADVFELAAKMAANKLRFKEAWEEAAKTTSDHQAMDAVICPSAPSFSIPHGFPIWWGYTSLWNYLDYPSTILPLKQFALDLERDVPEPGYTPIQGKGGFDKLNLEMYDAEMFKSSPASLQIVTRPFRDEELLNVTEIVDKVVNGKN